MTTTPIRCRPRRWRCGDDTGSLVLAALLAIVAVGLSTLMFPVVMARVGDTRVQTQRLQALQAAQSGLEVGLSRIRAAQTAGAGQLNQLPCGTLSGSPDAAGAVTYSVDLYYLNIDPRGHALDNTWLTANKQTCRAAVTTYALLRSTGTDGSITRQLWGTYAFRTSNAPIPGGLIHAYQGTGPYLCLDAGSATPVVTTQVRMQLCSDGLPQQTWAYEKNLYISLVSSKTASNPAGLCLDAGAAHAAHNLVRLENCLSPTAARQQWSFGARANFQTTTDGQVVDDFCLNVQNPEVPGSPLELGSQTGSTCNVPGVFDTRQTFAANYDAGAGGAGPDTEQLVNLGQFGHCIDLPQKTNPAWVSVFPCNQAPDPADVALNEKWTLPTSPGGTISVTPINRTLYPGADYCLISPAAPDQYVDVTACPAGPLPRNVKWTVRGYTGNYATNYRIEDDYGYCLAAKDVALGDFHNPELQATKAILAVCDNSDLQKWNAPPDLAPSQFKDVGER